MTFKDDSFVFIAFREANYLREKESCITKYILLG